MIISGGGIAPSRHMPVERRVMGNYHARCGAGEKSEEILPETYLSLFGQIPQFTKKLATMRKYEISCTVVLQNLAQIKSMYDKDWGSIVGNCDSILLLGSSEYETQEYFSKKLGKTTIDTRNSSISHGGRGSTSLSTQQAGRELMLPEEIGQMDDSECILIIRGIYPFRGLKYQYDRHPNYKYTADQTKENLYKIKTRINLDAENNPENNVPKAEEVARAQSAVPEVPNAPVTQGTAQKAQTTSSVPAAWLSHGVKMNAVQNDVADEKKLKKPQMATPEMIQDLFKGKHELEQENVSLFEFDEIDAFEETPIPEELVATSVESVPASAIVESSATSSPASYGSPAVSADSSSPIIISIDG